MADSYHVRLDFEKIRQRIRWSDDGPTSIADVKAWLHQNDFIDAGGGWWTAEEISLELLEKGEAIEHRRLA